MIAANELRIGNWVKIPDWEEYEISEKGEVFSLRRGRMLKNWSMDGKYPRVTLSINNKEKSFTVHRLVAKAFIPNPLNKRTVNHIDGVKTNYHVSNLEWCTQSENQLHAYNTGLSTVPHLPNGENHPSAKLNNIDIEMIKVLLKHDFTQEQIAKRFNIHNVHVSLIKLGKTWKHLKN